MAWAFVNDRLVLATQEGTTRPTGDSLGLVPLPDGDAFAAWTARKDDSMALSAARLGLAP